MKCGRTACKAELTDTYYKIWNEPSTGLPNFYCWCCGKKIASFNPTLKVEPVSVAVVHPVKK